jgi:MSHA biogenesis protein MshE
VELMETAAKRRLGDICVERGLISQEQLQKALDHQSESGTKLGEVLVELGFVTRVGLAGVLSEQWNDLRVSQGAQAKSESSLGLREQVRALTAELAERDKRIAQQDATISALLSQIGDGAAA